LNTRRAIWATAVAALVLLGAVGTWFLLPPSTGFVVIDVEPGPGGAQVRGSCNVDGNHRDLSCTAPARFTIEGHKFVFSFAPEEETQAFAVKVAAGDREFGWVRSGPTHRGIHGLIEFERFSFRYGINTFDSKTMTPEQAKGVANRSPTFTFPRSKQ